MSKRKTKPKMTVAEDYAFLYDTIGTDIYVTSLVYALGALAPGQGIGPVRHKAVATAIDKLIKAHILEAFIFVQMGLTGKFSKDNIHG